MNYKTVSTSIFIASCFANANQMKVKEIKMENCVKIDANIVLSESKNIAKIMCFDSTNTEEQIQAEVEKYLNSNNLKTQDVILAT